MIILKLTFCHIGKIRVIIFFCVNATIGMENANNFYAAQMNSHFISSLNSIYDVRTRNMQRSVEQTSCDKKEHRSHIAICMHYIC